VAGGRTDLSGNEQLDVRCIFVPTTSDLAVHLWSYVLLLTILAGGVAGVWAVWSERRRTTVFLQQCLGCMADEQGALHRAAERVGLAGRVDLVDAVEPRCFCYGLMRARVVVTTGLLTMLSEPEVEAVLRHEAYHVRNRDPLRLIVGRTLVSAFFFIPALRDLFTHYRLHVELAADTEAVRQMGGPQSLAAALDKLLDLRVPGPKALPSIAYGSSLELRIDSLLGEPVRLSVRTSALRVATSLLLLLLFTAPGLTPLVAGEREVLAILAPMPHAAC
jgi:Zn-dependent protease with chaperone function